MPDEFRDQICMIYRVYVRMANEAGHWNQERFSVGHEHWETVKARKHTSVKLWLGVMMSQNKYLIDTLMTLAPWKKNYDQPRQHIKKQIHYFANKSLSNQSYGFSSGHVWMWELD